MLKIMTRFQELKTKLSGVSKTPEKDLKHFDLKPHSKN